jgi:hypothetical protein
MALDLTSFASALKSHYTNDRVENMVYQDNPLLALMPKMESFGGKNLPIPIIYGNPQGTSATFATAQANKTSSKLKDFVLTRVRDYSLASIDNETLEASKGNANAFMEAATTEIDGALHSCSRRLAIAMYGSGSGSIGQVLAGATGTTFTLKNTDDVTNFEVGQELVFSTADGGGSVKAGSVTVNGIDRDSGVITVDALTAIAATVGAATNDYVFQQGDYDARLSGLRAWVPDSAPASTAFFGVDRTADVTRLGGIRFDGSAMPIEEALIGAASRVAREGGKPGHCFMNYSKFADLEKALGSKVQYVDVKANAEIGFRGIQINGPRGPIKVIPDQNCPSKRAFMLQMDVWKLYTLGKAPRILDADGMKMLREAASDSVEIRVGWYGQMGCRAPGHNVNIKLEA